MHEVANVLNADPLVSNQFSIEVIAWDWGAGVPLDALNSPQTSVNNHLPLPENCDVFVGIFKCRFGTPLPEKEYRKLDGKPYLSGSEYEFHRAWEARRRGAYKPTILIYRHQSEDNLCLNNEQWQRLNTFFQQTPFKEGEHWQGSTQRFVDTSDFRHKLDGHLRQLLSRQLPAGDSPDFSDWMRKQASLFATNAGPRYTAKAHIETDLGIAFDWLMTRQSIIAQLDKALAEVWGQIARNNATFKTVHTDMNHIAQGMRADAMWQQQVPDFPLIEKTLENIWTEYEKHKKEEQRETEQQYSLQQAVRKAKDAHELVQMYASLTTSRVMLLKGPAGQGKTHTLAHEIERTVNAGGIAVGVLGQTLAATGDLWQAICQRIDWTDTHGKLLDRLENEAANKGQRAMLVIDALNETLDRRRWRTELLGMIQDVLQRPHLVLVLSVRDNYMSQTLPEHDHLPRPPWVEWWHAGFSGIEPSALHTYFGHYDVKAPVAPPIAELANPLYLRLLAKSMQGQAVKHWLPSWLEVWKAWMQRIEEEAKDQLNLDSTSRREPIHRTMNELAQAMLDTGTATLPRTQADEIAKRITGIDHVISFLCSAGALIDRLDDDKDLIEFGFERLSDTFFADCLLKKIFKGNGTKEAKQDALKKALDTNGLLHPLTLIEYSEHPLSIRRSGLLHALCLAVPPQTGVELHTLFPSPVDEDDWMLSEAFSDSLRWRSQPQEFGENVKKLKDRFWQYRNHAPADLDYWIGLALIPTHPLGMAQVLHPFLKSKNGAGERDAIWSVNVAQLWRDEHSNLKRLVIWASNADLTGIDEEVALPAAQLLAWFCSVTQLGLRLSAIKGLTKLLAACPSTMKKFLPDFLQVNDAYVLEAVLIAVWGVVQDKKDPTSCSEAAQLVVDVLFPNGQAKWIHITVRHYARKIIEEAVKKSWLPDKFHKTVQPPYQSHLPLDQVPDKATLSTFDESIGYEKIIFSCMKEGDFYYYIMGGRSDSLGISSRPLQCSKEPCRPFVKSKNIRQHGKRIFDLALAARFVAWHCLSMGWTKERFEEFDTGYYTGEFNYQSDETRTERIGKKYQWISWHTLLGFLTDNYVLMPDWDSKVRHYESPDQLGVVLHDPARWLCEVPVALEIKQEEFWNMPNMPPWPRHNIQDMQRWIKSSSYDLHPGDVIATVPKLPEVWGAGPWILLGGYHAWKSDFSPGHWTSGKAFISDISWHIQPVLIEAKKFPTLIQRLDKLKKQRGTINSVHGEMVKECEMPLTQWPDLHAELDNGFREARQDACREFRLPVPWKQMLGMCGHPDYHDRYPTLLPVPSLFREWGLQLDLRRGLVLHNGAALFGLAGLLLREDALFCHVPRLQKLLRDSGYALLWSWRGERRAFMNLGLSRTFENHVWADYEGIGYLGEDGRIQTAWMQKEIES